MLGPPAITAFASEFPRAKSKTLFEFDGKMGIGEEGSCLVG